MVSAVQAIYARENGQGICLGDASEENVPVATVDGETPQVAQPGSKPPHLTIVK